MNRLVKNYFYNILYQGFLIIIPLITAPYLTRTLSAGALGIYDYINSALSIITTVGLFGLQSYGYRQIAYFRDNREDVSREFTSIFMLRVLLFIALAVIYLPLTALSEYKKYYYIQFALIAAQFLDVSWVFIGFEDLKIVSLRNLEAKLLTVIGIFIFVKGEEDLWIYFALFAYITLATTLSLFPFLKKYVSFRRVSFFDAVKHLKGSAGLFLPQVATLLYLQVDKIMLKELTDTTAQVAYYSYAEKIITLSLSMITALGTVMTPRLANLHSNENKAAIQGYMTKTIQFALFLSIPMMVGLAAISDTFIPWYLGEEYLASAKAILILSPVCVLNALSHIYGAQYLTAVNKTKELTIAYYSTAAINIVLNAVLIPKLAFIGAAAATLFSSFLSVLILRCYVRKEISFSGLGKDVVKIVLSTVIMWIVLYLIKRKLPVSAGATFLEVALGGVVFLAAALLMKEEIILSIPGKIIGTGRKK